MLVNLLHFIPAPRPFFKHCSPSRLNFFKVSNQRAYCLCVFAFHHLTSFRCFCVAHIQIIAHLSYPVNTYYHLLLFVGSRQTCPTAQIRPSLLPIYPSVRPSLQLQRPQLTRPKTKVPLTHTRPGLLAVFGPVPGLDRLLLKRWL